MLGTYRVGGLGTYRAGGLGTYRAGGLGTYRTRDDDYAMNVIGHHNVGIQFHVRCMLWNRQPAVAHNLPPSAVPHFAIYNFPQQALPTTHANGDKIGTG